MAGPSGAPLLFRSTVRVTPAAATTLFSPTARAPSGTLKAWKGPASVTGVGTAHLLVLPPAEFHSGGADVHVARPRLARPDRRSRIPSKLHLAIFLPHHRPGRGGGCGGDAEGRCSSHRLVVRRGVAVLAARGLLLLFTLPARPKVTLSAMDRNWYYIGIAFFGMINGLFNQLALLFALIYRQGAGAGPVVRQRAVDADVSSLMVSTGTIILARHPGVALRALYRRQGRLRPKYRCGFGWRVPAC